MSVRVAFRADASNQIGSGHVMRCLTLADDLKLRGAVSMFVCREFDGNLCDFIANRGHAVYRLERPVFRSQSWLGADWERDAAETSEALTRACGAVDCLVVDHYAIDSKWEGRLRSRTRSVAVIDDLGDRPHDCDAILDQNYYEGLESRYDRLVPTSCLKLLGPRHVLLRKEFAEARGRASARDGKVKRLLVFLGGSDPDNITGRVVTACSRLDPGLRIDVVVGASNPRAHEVEAMCARLPMATFHVQVQNISELMLAADLAVGAGGATTWERCILGLPTLTVVIADNQLRTSEDLARLGVIWYLGRAQELNAGAFEAALREALGNAGRLHLISTKSLEFMAQVPKAAGNELTSFIMARAAGNE